MKKLLIIIIITLTCYLGYNQLMSNENESPVTMTEKVEQNMPKTNTDSIVRTEEAPSLDTGVDVTKINYFGVYSQNRTTDAFEAELTVEIIDETNYRHKRVVTKDGEQKIAEVQGSYKIINGSVVQLFYPEDRDKTIFPTPKALFTIKEDGSLASGDWQLTKQ